MAKMKKATKKSDTIPILGVAEEATTGLERGLFRRSTDVAYRREEVSATILKTEISTIVTRMETMLNDLPAPKGKFEIDSFSFSLEISAKGTVTLLGTGGEVAGKGGLEITVRRASPTDGKK